MDEIERAYDELMATYKQDASGRFVIDLNDTAAIERRRELRRRLDGCWGVVAKIRHDRRVGGFRR